MSVQEPEVIFQPDSTSYFGLPTILVFPPDTPARTSMDRYDHFRCDEGFLSPIHAHNLFYRTEGSDYDLAVLLEEAEDEEEDDDEHLADILDQEEAETSFNSLNERGWEIETDVNSLQSSQPIYLPLEICFEADDSSNEDEYEDVSEQEEDASGEVEFDDDESEEDDSDDEEFEIQESEILACAHGNDYRGRLESESDMAYANEEPYLSNQKSCEQNDIYITTEHIGIGVSYFHPPLESLSLQEAESSATSSPTASVSGYGNASSVSTPPLKPIESNLSISYQKPTHQLMRNTEPKNYKGLDEAQITSKSHFGFFGLHLRLISAVPLGPILSTTTAPGLNYYNRSEMIRGRLVRQ
ncbi:MAG: hypothetical protein M1834_007307 [Cirrosporium novae-zelandiae]|nr:MAG: hypothetical protein M1834_007307 [Cirrosporium novae-zelandiae]